jgi:hypothetical protein
MTPSPTYAATLTPIATIGSDRQDVGSITPEQFPYSAKMATRVYEGVTIAAILLLLGSLWVF